MRIVVVLPAPFGPRKPCTSPCGMDRSRWSKARVVPKSLTSPRVAMALERSAGTDAGVVRELVLM